MELTFDQNPELQRRDLLAFGCEKVFEEQISSRKEERPGLTAAMDFCREGDELVVWKLDRFGRSLRELIDLMGSVSDGVAHHATRPVLVMRGGEGAWPPTRVVVGEDLHEEAKAAARIAVDLGKLFGAEVRLVLAYPRFPQLSTQRVGVRLDAWTAEKGLPRAEEALEELAGDLERETGMRPQTQAAVGEAADLILEAAEEGGGPTLISVGNRDLARFVRARLGSVSSDVLRAANGPVLVHKRPAG